MKAYLTAVSLGLLSISVACGNAEKANQSAGGGLSPSSTSEPSQRPETAADSPESKAVQPATSSPYGSMLVDSANNLPTCDESREGSLAYVKSEKLFYVCSGEWQEASIKGEKGDKGDVGEAGKNGLGIAKVQILNNEQQNFCTEYSTIEDCRFMGGQVVRFADGSMFVTARWSYYSLMYATDFDSNTDVSTVAFIVPNEGTSMSYKLNDRVARGDGWKSVFIIYVAETKKFALVYDTNDSGDVDGSDEVLQILSLSDF